MILIISLFSIVFWMGFEQAGGTLNLFADEKTNRTLLGHDIPASVLPVDQPAVHHLAGARLRDPLDVPRADGGSRCPRSAKMGMGLILLGVGFGVMYLAEREAKSGQGLAAGWLISVYFFFTVAELCLSPIGLSLVNKLAHPRVASLMMAFWFLCTAAANYLAGIMERRSSPITRTLGVPGRDGLDRAGLMLLALTPVLVKMSHGRV